MMSIQIPQVVNPDEKASGDIIFNNLKFSYDDYRDILKNISFSIKERENL